MLKRFNQGGLAGLLAVTLLLGGCFGGDRAPEREQGDTTSPSPVTGGGGFYGGDRPPDRVPRDLDRIPDAVPTPLPRSKTGNKPYVVMGQSYTPMPSAKGYRATGIASWYGKKFHGRRTSSGEPYDMFAMTAAHTVLPLPSFVRVTNLDNGKSVVVKVNDRGPFLHDRLIDLSYAAAHRLDIAARGTGRVEVEVLDTGVVNSTWQAGGAAAVTQSPQQYSGVAGGNAAEDRPDPVAPSKPEPESEYLLQVGVFSDLVNALNLRSQLRGYGLPLSPPTDRSLAAGRGPWRVTVGPYRNRNEAEQIRQKLGHTIGMPVQLTDG